jgi:hypothetical protein
VIFIAKISKRMNVLILTPDAVGSTLLQRLITIYMQFQKYDKPVINLHELTNGLIKYHNATVDQDVLGKSETQDGWGYYQSLVQIVELLSAVDHYKISRLAHYHIKNRQDTIEQQLPFYKYLNDNFYIISCRRHNLFEHGLSWCLNKITKKLNVYDADEKINSFFDLYKTGLDIDPNSLVQTLNAYKDYSKWCNDHFNVASYFYYEEHLPNIEKYILGLPIFAQQQQLLTWKDNFDIEFDTWNCYHYAASDIGTLALDQPEKFAQLTNSSISGLIESSAAETEKQYEISKFNQNVGQSLLNLLPAPHLEFLNQNKITYDNSVDKIRNMVKTGILVSPPPIKKQTLAEKKHIINNYNHLLEIYNQWIVLNPDMGLPLSTATLDQFAQAERDRWNPSGPSSMINGVNRLI